MRVARLRVLGSANGFGTPGGTRPPMNIYKPRSWRGRTWEAAGIDVCGGVGAVTLGLGGSGSRLKGSPPLCSLSPPYEGPPAGSGIPERAGKRLRPIGASSQEGFNTWASPPRGLDKRTNLSANHFGSSSPFCPAACSGFEFIYWTP